MRMRQLFAIFILFCGIGLLNYLIPTLLHVRPDVSLEDIKRNTENYLGEKYAVFSIATITVREDPYHMLRETYFLVDIKDSNGYELPFVISSDDYGNYSAYIGEAVLFRLFGYLGHELVPPRGWLTTNMLAVKTHPLGLDYGVYYVYIALAGPVPYVMRLVPYLPIVCLAGASITMIVMVTAYLRRRSRVMKAGIKLINRF